MVWVRPCRLPAKVIVAPNSPSARGPGTAGRRRRSPGRSAGSVTAPERGPRAGAERGRGLLEPGVALRAAHPPPSTTRNGSATNGLGHHDPGRAEGQGQPGAPRRAGAPSSPRRPNAASSATPPTTGGSTSGTVTSARPKRRRRPGRRGPAPHASGTPRTRQSPVAQIDEQISESTSASVTTDDRTMLGRRRDQGTRTSRAASGQRQEEQRRGRPGPAAPAAARRVADAHGVRKPYFASTAWPSSDSTSADERLGVAGRASRPSARRSGSRS